MNIRESGNELKPDLSSRFQTTLSQSILLITFVGLLIGILAILVGFLRREIDLFTFLIAFGAIVLLVIRPLVVFSLGPLLVGLGQPKIAERLYSSMIRLAPQFGFAYFQRASLKQNRKSMDDALLDYEIALDIVKSKAALSNTPLWSVNYSAALIHANKADIYLFKGDIPSAIVECNNGLALDENNQGIALLLKFQRGYAQLLNANYEEALLDLNSLYFDGDLAPNERPVEIELYALRALAYANLVDFDEAKSLWEKAVALDSNYANLDWLRDTHLWPSHLLSLTEKLN